MNVRKKAAWILQLFDIIWSVPVAALFFIGTGWFIQAMFTDPADPQGGPGFYDPSFIQAAFYATFIQVFVNGMVWLGIFFNFRGMWWYYAGKETENGTIANQSKADFQKLSEWQRIKLLLFMYCFLSVEWLFLFNGLR